MNSPRVNIKRNKKFTKLPSENRNNLRKLKKNIKNLLKRRRKKKGKKNRKLRRHLRNRRKPSDRRNRTIDMPRCSQISLKLHLTSSDQP